MAKKAIILLATGFEEVEAVTPIDYLRRSGIEVTTAAIGDSRKVTGSHGISVEADTTLNVLAERSDWDAALIPGGMPGATNLAASKEVSALLSAMARSGKIVAAICASPAVVLAPLGLLAGKRFTCYPGMEKDLDPAAQWSADRVVIDGNLITSRGAGTAALFAFAVIEQLLGKAAAEKISQAVLYEG
ncbi:MAG: DJ-1/PfpI family protein [Treponema sp.]|jgi:4-methyl-5(b-hydroxyethyl)-thiazole monophosphate biosynthesis|nr:DJ-1/PfpI family protein [Treponema sp.]